MSENKNNINGGVNARQGFSYQDFVIAFIFINHYDSENFTIFVENQDDAEVFFKNLHIFIQTKGEKDLTIAKLLNEQIIKKNINKEATEGKDNRYKIIIPKSFFKDLKKLVETRGELLDDSVYTYTENEKLNIKNQLKEIKNIDNKIDKSFIYLSPFDKNFKYTYNFLTGFMSNEKNIIIDDNQGKTALNELLVQIQQKSTIPIENEKDYNNKKTLKKSDFEGILKNSKLNFQKEEIITNIKQKNHFKDGEIQAIKKSSLEININRSLYNKIKSLINIPIDTISFDDIDILIKLYNETIPSLTPEEQNNKYLIYSIIIDIMANNK